jgi:hypothetical protein
VSGVWGVRRHRIALIVLSICCVLAGGAAVSYIVAWLVANQGYVEMERFAHGNADVRWPRRVPADWPERASAVSRDVMREGWGNRRGWRYYAGDELAGGRMWFVCTREAGWPLRCVVDSAMFTHTGPLSREAVELPAAITHWIGIDALPWRPLPLGLLVNSVLYGWLIWALASMRRRVRRVGRRRRGLCPTCAYELRGLEKCPECGGAA